MKINQEKFYKLNQLDRIEFRQKEERISKKWGFFITPYSIIYCIIIIGFLILLAVGMYSINKDVTYSLIEKGLEMYRVSLYIIMGTLIVDVLLAIKKGSEMNKLEEEFFLTSPKKK